jgi:hypothetical protein
MKVTITDLKPNGTGSHLHGKTAELLIYRYEPMLEVDFGLAYVERETEWSKGYVVPVQKQFEGGKWIITEGFSFAPSKSDDDIDHWLTLLRIAA